jgi:hypothetical protein
MLVMHEGQWRLDMKSVVVVVVIADISSLVRGRSIMGVDGRRIRWEEEEMCFETT